MYHNNNIIILLLIIRIFHSIIPRREALRMWKEKLGSGGTYKKLLEVFKRAGYETYADNVRRTVQDGDIAVLFQTETYPFLKPQSDDEDDPALSQPLSYPSLKPLCPSPQFTPIQLSPQDYYVLINPAIAENLPEGENIL